jgi:hypothetical protein
VVVKDELHEGETLIANSSSRPHERAAATSKPVSLPVNLACEIECVCAHTNTCIHKHPHAYTNTYDTWHTTRAHDTWRNK